MKKTKSSIVIYYKCLILLLFVLLLVIRISKREIKDSFTLIKENFKKKKKKSKKSKGDDEKNKSKKSAMGQTNCNGIIPNIPIAPRDEFSISAVLKEAGVGDPPSIK